MKQAQIECPHCGGKIKIRRIESGDVGPPSAPPQVPEKAIFEEVFGPGGIFDRVFGPVKTRR